MKVDLKNIKTEFLSYLKSERGFSGHTLESYSNDIGVFIDYCSTIFLTDNIDLDSISIICVYIAPFDTPFYL